MFEAEVPKPSLGTNQTKAWAWQAVSPAGPPGTWLLEDTQWGGKSLYFSLV